MTTEALCALHYRQNVSPVASVITMTTMTVFLACAWFFIQEILVANTEARLMRTTQQYSQHICSTTLKPARMQQSNLRHKRQNVSRHVFDVDEQAFATKSICNCACDSKRSTARFMPVSSSDDNTVECQRYSYDPLIRSPCNCALL